MKKTATLLLALLPTLGFAQFSPTSAAASRASLLPQGSAAQSAQETPAPANNNNSSSVVSNNGNLFESTTLESFADRIFDTNSDSVDWDNGTINWKGKTYSIGNSRVVRARFERYLATDMTDEGIYDYKEILTEIVTVMSSKNTDSNSTTLKYAWELLFDAGEFSYDNDSCVSIANSVDAVLRSQREFAELKKKEEETKKAKEAAAERALNAERYAEKRAIAKEKRTNNNSNKNKLATLGPSPIYTSADLAYHKKSEVSKKVELEEKQTASTLLGTNVVIQYQSMIVSFLMARRFSHAAIACDFYRELFKSSRQGLEVGKKEISEMIPISKLSPSVDGLQTIAFEGRNDVILGMQAINALYNNGERYSALQRLLETFFLGEHEADVLSFPYDKKQVLYSIYRDASTIKDLADARDLDGIEKLIEAIQKNANDFPVAEIMAKVNIAKTASNLKVAAARQAAFMEDKEGVERHISDAATIWPLNPKITELNAEIMDMATGAALHKKNFEKNLEEQNYRAIAADAVDLAMVFRNDPEKLNQIKDIVKTIGTIDMLIAQSDEFQKQNNHYFAWELLENALLIDENDIVLARAVAQLAPRVADFVRLMNAAKLAEGNRNYPEALINYLRAKQISPTSQVCRLAINRLSKRYLD